MRRSNCLTKSLLVMLASSCLLASSGPASAAPAGHQPALSDIRGTWAEQQIADWVSNGLVSGYPGGTFQPDKPITRAEFFALINRAFGYSETALANAPDVDPADWYAEDIAKATAVGYASSYPDGTIRPDNLISRQEAAAILYRVLPPAVFSLGTLSALADNGQIPGWSRSAVAEAFTVGYMKGYPDGSFQPTKPMTRAEAVSTLNRAVGTRFATAGVFGPASETATIDGNATISAPGITLRNTVVRGNLYLTEGIGDGRVVLENVVVMGTTRVAGGGVHSVAVISTTLGPVSVDVPDGACVRLVVSGSSSIGTVTASSDAILQEDGVTGQGFVDVVIPERATVQLSGVFGAVQIDNPGTNVEISNGSVSSMTISQAATDSTVTLSEGASIGTLFANAAATLAGQGTVGMVTVDVAGQQVTRSDVAVGSQFTTVIGGLTVVGGAEPVHAGEAEDDGSPPPAPATQATPSFSPASGELAFGTRVQITSSDAEHIYYTIDGSTPAPSVGGSTMEYDDNDRPAITKAMSVKAIATRMGYSDSAIGSAAYTQAATADLMGLELTGGPANYSFSGSTYGYDSVTVANVVDTITVTPTGSGTITVDGTTVTSGTASTGILLTPGTPRAITVAVTEAGKSAKTYTLTVTRELPIQAPPSFSPAAGAVAFGTRVQITSSGAEHIYYTIDGSTPATSVGGSTMEYDDNNRPVITKAMTVKAVATQTSCSDSAVGSAAYTQAATADLWGMQLSGNPVDFSFSGSTYTYSLVHMPKEVDGVFVTPIWPENITGTITVNDKLVPRDLSSQAIPLDPGKTETITVVATEEGKSPKTYTITVMRMVSLGEVAAGSGTYFNGNRISFGMTFSQTPIVFVNGYDSGPGYPLAAAAVEVDTEGFTLSAQSLQGAWNGGVVQWVAIVPASGVEVQAGSVNLSDGEDVAFSNAFLSSCPVVVCSAYYDSLTGPEPLLAAAYNMSKDGFTVSLKDTSGSAATGLVSYIAISQPADPNYYDEAAIVSGYGTYGHVVFDLTRNADVVLCSAQASNVAVPVTARNSSRYGFDVAIYSEYVDTAGAATSWMAFGIK